MKTEGVYKVKSNGEMESDHIVLVDDNKKEIELFWFVHEVVVFAKDGGSFKFSKNESPQAYDILLKIAEQIKTENDNVKEMFFKGNKFTWHHMARSWEKPFEDEDGFAATLNNDCVEVNFFPGKTKKPSLISEYFISMGGPDGYTEPYQSVSTIFSFALNELLLEIPYDKTHDCVL